jgi:hypothetical protein
MSIDTMTYGARISYVREHYARARTIERNRRLRRYDGRNGNLTAEALSHHYERAAMHERVLPRELAGLLRSEHGLRLRLSEARDLGQDRPELKKRLKTTAAAIKAYV